jgi:hypothetical protein
MDSGALRAKGKIMRKKDIRPELRENGVLVNSLGVEIARLTLNNLLIINEQELYFSIVRAANTTARKAAVTKLNPVYSVSGGWGFDMNVELALRHLEELGVIECDRMGSDKIYFCWPITTPAQAIKKIPVYVTRAETHAGLEEVHE